MAPLTRRASLYYLENNIGTLSTITKDDSAASAVLIQRHPSGCQSWAMRRTPLRRSPLRRRARALATPTPCGCPGTRDTTARRWDTSSSAGRVSGSAGSGSEAGRAPPQRLCPSNPPSGSAPRIRSPNPPETKQAAGECLKHLSRSEDADGPRGRGPTPVALRASQLRRRGGGAAGLVGRAPAGGHVLGGHPQLQQALAQDRRGPPYPKSSLPSHPGVSHGRHSGRAARRLIRVISTRSGRRLRPDRSGSEPDFVPIKGPGRPQPLP